MVAVVVCLRDLMIEEEGTKMKIKIDVNANLLLFCLFVVTRASGSTLRMNLRL
jgi:hypothetical protein